MKHILINATQQEEIRVAMVNDNYLVDFQMESRYNEDNKSNIYIGIIENIAHALNAAFVDYGKDKRGFIPLDDIRRIYPNEKVRPHQKLVIQIQKDERGTKGAYLTTNIGLPGKYLVFMPISNNKIGISRKIQGEERSRLKEITEQLDVPEGSGLIVRTSCIDRNLDILKNDLTYLKNLWSTIQEQIEATNRPKLIFKESNVVIRALRDYLQDDIDAVLVDNKQTFHEARHFVKSTMPHYVDKIKLYEDNEGIFTVYKIEEQIESAFKREVALKSGGAIVIDHTEAMTTIDINSKHSHQGRNIEDTALKTNLEAGYEIIRQIKIRDIGGLIVIDFIDMQDGNHNRKVQQLIRDLSKDDRARIQISNISPFGLMEISRQRLGTSLAESSHTTCPRCNGQGYIRDLESLAISILRVVAQKATARDEEVIRVEAPIEVASFILNDLRDNLLQIENLNDVKVIIVPVLKLQSPDYTISTSLLNDSANLGQEMASSSPSTQKKEELSSSKINGPIRPRNKKARTQHGRNGKIIGLDRIRANEKESFFTKMVRYFSSANDE
ncbi:MAG: hypothetical protein A2504_02950 [Bdellovibrionales bacterium RIFOXYD12_FULL_39_22]|nr:MAG: hypothetical protein A2385_05665 [Bdellovibrionales bacterium RIFOXYB1_FULL_39_21]OFZ42240.1 MAG: hypothetical protein A2485_15695 [Bdellovibrionales bacterium RIFOXYC12_FULL_39_17]OFZ46668.1 MAG: hypothetical protein A2404_03975 [Bdellovibrionales bacterium RIFOXYC1_FULL_39_130]OFZ76055.1 MAG: hypothetical protein A2560_03175 [Bdellovibrionales bacterium RIFOXYD1_FULL_39_84]OFZ93039.1 MAG: hypothetical protein A2504_02950 [Bdellovibrionales bacterium RIFOXYD12_FULL_39_22]HLE09933.1 Rn